MTNFIFGFSAYTAMALFFMWGLKQLACKWLGVSSYHPLPTAANWTIVLAGLVLPALAVMLLNFLALAILGH